jgi:predicted nucleotidyltransferase
MASLIKELEDRKLITPPQFLASNVHYETIMGSFAYGVSSDTSDTDVYGFCIPPKHIIFPHVNGTVIGFDNDYPKFEQYQQHHIKREDNNKEYDVAIYNIVKYFRLCVDGNPNMIDSLFTPTNCVVHITKQGQLVRDSRKLFLSKKCWHTFKGYAYQQMSKIRKGTNKSNPRRAKWIQDYGYDVKFAYHLVRLLDEVEQILTEGDIDLQRNRKQLIAIRNGEWELKELENYFVEKEKSLEKVYLESDAVPHKPRDEEIKNLLLSVLEEHYGSLDSLIQTANKDRQILDEIRRLVR